MRGFQGKFAQKKNDLLEVGRSHEAMRTWGDEIGDRPASKLVIVVVDCRPLVVDVVGGFTLQCVGLQHVLHGVGMCGVVLVVVGTSPPRQGHLSSLSHWGISDSLHSLYQATPD